MRVEGKVVLLSGGASGIGAASARLVVREGGKAVLADRDEAKGRALAAELGERALFVALDVTDEIAWQRAVAAAIETFGGLHGLLNAAGVGVRNSIEDCTLEEYRRVNDVNSLGTFLGCKAAIPAMKQSGGGSIVNISSVAAMIGGSFAHYSAAKGGIRALTRATAVEYAQHNVRANSVYPGLIETPLTAGALANPEIREMLRAATALPRFGRAEDIGYCVLYLASDESAFATGAEFVIDGGVTAK